MLIFALEGVHGVGKSTLMQNLNTYFRIPCLKRTGDLESANWSERTCIIEYFSNLSNTIDFLSRWSWQVRHFIEEYKDKSMGGFHIRSIVVERSLLSPAFYSEDEIYGDHMLKMIPSLHAQFAKEGHTIITVYLRRNLEAIRHQLMIDAASRYAPNVEKEIKALETVFKKYEEYPRWDCIIDIESGIPITQPWKCVIRNTPQDTKERSLDTLSRSLAWEINGWEAELCWDPKEGQDDEEIEDEDDDKVDDPDYIPKDEGLEKKKKREK
jgi:thymidylate kinase